jgi:ABC-type polysaccharide/polyol phosphate export permease
VRAEGYLKKVYIPKLVFPLVAVGVEIANFLLSLVGLFLMALFLGARASWGLAFLPLALLLTSLFITGIVLVVSILTVYFRDLAHILQIGFTGLFYLTPIIYKKEFFTSGLLVVIKLNPFFYFVELFHAILYRAEIPEASLWLTCAGLTDVSLLLGAWVFSSKEGDVIYRL